MSSAAQDEQAAALETVKSVTLTQDNDGSIILHCPPHGAHSHTHTNIPFISFWSQSYVMSRCDESVKFKQCTITRSAAFLSLDTDTGLASGTSCICRAGCEINLQ